MSRECIRRGLNWYELENARSTCAERATRDCNCIGSGRTREIEEKEERKGQLHSYGQRVLDATAELRRSAALLYEDSSTNGAQTSVTGNLFKYISHFSEINYLNEIELN